MPQATGLGKRGTHDGWPGSIVSAGTKLVVGGVQIAAVGDSYYCTHEDHAGHYALTSSGAASKIRINGQQLACVGTQAACGAVITEGVDKLNV